MAMKITKTDGNEEHKGRGHHPGHVHVNRYGRATRTVMAVAMMTVMAVAMTMAVPQGPFWAVAMRTVMEVAKSEKV